MKTVFLLFDSLNRLMPTHMTIPFFLEELRTTALLPPVPFAKELLLLKIAHRSKADSKIHSYHFPEKWKIPNQ